MLYKNFTFVLCVCVLLMGGACMVATKKSNKCEKQARQLSNRIKNTAKDFKYISKSFDCNIQYIFDGAYSQFYSDVDILNRAFERSTDDVLEKCKKTHDFSILSQQPYDLCYNRSLLSEQYSKFNEWEKEVTEICQHCDSTNEEECVGGLKEMSQELEDFKNTIHGIVKNIEKNVEACVVETSVVVNKTLEDINRKFNSCVYS